MGVCEVRGVMIVAIDQLGLADAGVGINVEFAQLKKLKQHLQFRASLATDIGTSLSFRQA